MVLADLTTRLSVIKNARVLTIPPPPVQGIGSAGGFKMMLEDRAGLGSEAVVRAANDLVAAANKDPHFAGVFTLFNTGSPSVYTDIDRLDWASSINSSFTSSTAWGGKLA